MKEINSQLTDAMIIALADAFDTGVDFSDAVKLSKIPEIAVIEANDYWCFLSEQNKFSSTISPDISIIDSLFSRLDTFSPEISIKEHTPSPYMKYVMVFAAPLSILVMILGITFRQDSAIDTKPNIIEPTVYSLSANVPEVSEVKPQEPRVSPSANAMLVKSAKVEIDPEAIANEDPKQLFALISEVGSYESQSEVEIDNQYDAQLSELDSKVIDSNNSNAYVPL